MKVKNFQPPQIIIQKPTKEYRILAAIYLVLCISSIIFPSNVIIMLFTVFNYYILSGFFGGILLGIGKKSFLYLIGFSLALSPALAIIVLYTITTFFSGNLANATTAVTLVDIALAVAVLIYPSSLKSSSRDEKSLVDRWFLGGILFIVGLLIPLIRPGVQISYHGLFHTSVVHSILNGAIPPPNPGFYEAAINTYWHFHLFLAAIVAQGNISVLVASVILRFTSLIAMFIFAGLIAHRINQQLNPWLVAIFALFCVNLAGPLLFLLDLPSSDRLLQLWNGDMSNPTEAVRAMIMGDKRTADILSKFLNFNAFCYAMMLWGGAIAVMLEKRLPQWSRSVLFLIFSIATISFHVPSSVAILLLLPLAIYFAPLLANRSGVTKIRVWQIATIGLPFLMALGFTAPYWSSVLTAHADKPADQGWTRLIISSPAALKHNLTLVLGVYFPILPILILTPLVRKKLSETQIQLLILVVGCLGLALMLRMPGNNQYKFIYLAALPIGISVANITQLLFASKSLLRRTVNSLGLILATLAATLITIGYLRSAWWRETHFGNRDSNIEYSTTNAYKFLREKTAKTAVIVEAPTVIDGSLVGAIGKRQSYFKVDHWGYYQGLPKYKERETLVKRIFLPGIDKVSQIKHLATSVGSEVYIILDPKVVGEAYGSLKAEFKAEPLLKLVYEDGEGSVFKILKNSISQIKN